MSMETRVVFPTERETASSVLLGFLDDPSPNSSLMQVRKIRSLEGLCVDQYLDLRESSSEPLRVSSGLTFPSSVNLADAQNLVTYYGFFVQAATSGCPIAGIPLESKVLSSTAPRQTSPGLESSIQELLELAELVEFEDGMENALTQKLAAFVARNSSVAVEKLGTMILGSRVGPEVAAQTLLCLGRIEEDASYLARSWVLQRALFSPSAKVRDAATVGLASLNDAHAVVSLVRAIEIERIHDLKIDMERVLSYLRSAA